MATTCYHKQGSAGIKKGYKLTLRKKFIHFIKNSFASAIQLVTRAENLDDCLGPDPINKIQLKILNNAGMRLITLVM